MNYYSPEQVADMYGISVSKVKRFAAARTWPHLRIGQTVRFTDEHLARIDQISQVDASTQQTVGPWGSRRTRRTA